MKTLQELIKTQLPMNRKERFFTGTVLPMIIAKNNFQHLHLLLSALGIEPIPKITAQPPFTNIQFFTEYSLLESLHRTDRIFKDLPATKDTPDLIILIDEPENKILIALEAKMYSSPRLEELEKQMKVQGNILRSISKTLNVNATYHFALLPEELESKQFPIITWQTICELFDPVTKDDYFMMMLKLALQEYPTLASSSESSYGKNNQKSMSGLDIYESFKNQTLENQFMGRDKGINGQLLENDLLSGDWKTRKYETRKTELFSNRNWFAVEEFVKKIDLR